MPQNAFFHKFAIFWSAKKQRKDTFFPPSIPFPWYFLQLQQYWHLYCFAILGSTFTVIHSVKQCLLRNQPGCDAATSCAKDYKGHSLVQTSLTEPPSTQRWTFSSPFKHAIYTPTVYTDFYLSHWHTCKLCCSLKRHV